ncbi:hypothetical protein VTN02DRAFT_1154 [Thermoascus thermophilus]
MANPLQPATGPIPLTIPHRFLFIASIGNKAPYRTTRHSAGHTLLEAIEPVLATRMPLTIPRKTTNPVPGLSKPPRDKATPAFYQTYASPTFMNVSGPKLVRTLEAFLAEKRDVCRRLREGTLSMSSQDGPQDETASSVRGEWTTTPGTSPSRPLARFHPTLVILHDELEAPLGKVRVKRGGPDQASLRGHRGLISVMESLRGKGLLQPAGQNQNQKQDDERLSILRIGVGIGRPASRQRDDVADYVLTEMSPEEMAAVRAAAGPAVEVLLDEFYRAPEVD